MLGKAGEERENGMPASRLGGHYKRAQCYY